MGTELAEINSKDFIIEKPEGKLDAATKLRVQVLLRKLFNMGVMFDVPITQITRDHFPGFPVATINGILKSILPEINSSIAIDAQFKFDGMYQKILQEGLQTAQTGIYDKDGEKMYALDKAAGLIDKYITFMERFGIKPKIPDVIQTEKGPMTVDTMKSIYDISMERKDK